MRTLSMIVLSLCLSFSQAHAAEKADVVASIKPLHSLVQGVMGDTGAAALVVTGAASPHGFALKPSQLQLLHHAKIVFYIDDSFEHFLTKAFATMPEGVKRHAVVQHADLTLLERRAGGVWEEHVHHEEGHHDHHDHHDHHGHVDHAEAVHDMHIWLDPENSQKITTSVAAALSAAYPENRARYEANAAALITRLKALDEELRTALAGVQQKPFIVLHDAYQYFEQRYGLTGVGAITLEPEMPPSIHRMQQIRKKVADAQAVCVFREPQFSDKLVKAVLEGSEAQSATLDPLGADLAPGPELYFTLMRDLAAAMNACLTPQ